MKRKYTIAALALAALIGLTSCSDDFLNLSDPNRESSDTFWKTEDQFNQGLSASYAIWRRPGMFSRWFHVLMELRSDEGWSSSPNQEFQAIADFKNTAYNYDSNESVRLPWQETFNQIFYVNQVLDQMKDHGYDVMSKEQGDLIMGQAYFIRATAYWYIASTYGRAPLQLTSQSDGKVVDQKEMFQQVLADYVEAEKLLPVKWTNSEDLGRPTRGAAMGQAARVMMQLAGIDKRPESANADEAKKYWTEAKTKIEEIFRLNVYSLVPNWIDNFTDKNENNSESLFEINFKDGLTDGKETGMQRPKFLGLYLSDGTGAWDDGSSRDWMLDEFDKERQKDGKPDLRKYYTLFYDNPEDTMKYYGKTMAEWKAAGLLGSKKTYWRKYTSVDSDNKPEDYSSGVNFRVLRLADVYLMYAEVLNELGTDRATAVEYINKVRRRVNMADLNPALFNDYETLKDQIRHERLVELCGECTRWNDLDRWGDLHNQEAINKLAEHDHDFSTFRLGVSHKYIIPMHELSLYPGLTQNPGY